MTFVPLGFTEISSNYQTLNPAPAITGLPEDTQLTSFLSNEYLAVEEIVSRIPSLDEVTLISLQPDTNYPLVNSTVTVKATVKGAISSWLALRLVSPAPESFQNQKALILPLNNNEVVTFSFATTDEAALLQLIAHPVESNTEISLIVPFDEYRDLPVISNLITLFVQPRLDSSSTSVVLDSNLLTSQPFYDVVAQLTENVLRAIIIDQILDLAPTNPQPHGSHGVGIYKDIGIPSPLNASLHRKVPSTSLQRLLGMALDQLKRLEGWARKVLYLVHSDKSSLPNSELKLLLNLLPSELKSAIERYAGFVEEAGKLASSVAQTYLPDYAQGNTVIKTNAVEQHNVGQFRVQTSSLFDVNAPAFTIASQQTLFQNRFEHHVGDIYQGSHLHVFLRAEDQMTQMSANAVQYTSGDFAQYSANSQQVSGSNVLYQDSEWNQVGQSSQNRIHAQKSDPTKANEYGSSTKLVYKDYKLATSIGEIIVNSGTHLHLHAKQGSLRLSSSQDIRVDATTSLVQRANQIQLSGSTKLVAGANEMSLTAKNNFIVKGKLVLINSGGSLSVPLQSEPKIITEQLRVFSQMTDPAPYSKETPVSPGPLGQNTPNTPEPNSTPAGSPDLGKHLTNVD